MAHYQSITKNIRAFQFGVEPVPAWFINKYRNVFIHSADTKSVLTITTATQESVQATTNDWVVVHEDGTISCMKPDEFSAQYEPAPNPTTRLKLDLSFVYPGCPTNRDFITVDLRLPLQNIIEQIADTTVCNHCGAPHGIVYNLTITDEKNHYDIPLYHRSTLK